MLFDVVYHFLLSLATILSNVCSHRAPHCLCTLTSSTCIKAGLTGLESIVITVWTCYCTLSLVVIPWYVHYFILCEHMSPNIVKYLFQLVGVLCFMYNAGCIFVSVYIVLIV